MIILLSPAKSLDFETTAPVSAQTEPRLAEYSQKLARAAGNLSKTKLKAIMPVSDKLIDLNYSRYRNFFDQPERAAIFAYNGDVYTGFEAHSLSSEQLDYAQAHVRILSGLYGLLKPFDKIRPHRLEMGTKWAPRYKRLTDFWGDKIAKILKDDVRGGNAQFVLNLASQEYYASIAPYTGKLGVPIVTIDFRQDGPDGPRFISFSAKQARGMMARYICEHHIDSLDAVKDFDCDGYRFDAKNSDERNLRFIRS